MRHPNIVQFLGVYFEEGAKMHIPMLIMEYLPMNLTTCIKKYGIPPESTQATDEHGILPMEISYSILYDVALDLHYLHKQTPPIIHRDLPTMSSLSDLRSACLLRPRPLTLATSTRTRAIYLRAIQMQTHYQQKPPLPFFCASTPIS